VLHKYVEARNRIAFGERTVIVMASKVAQKSYGQERRCVNLVRHPMGLDPHLIHITRPLGTLTDSYVRRQRLS
jgi:hypothetical protein